jgi:isoquinoline 1-oxidoreductase beta subunit
MTGLQVSRRTLLKAGAAGFLLGFHWPMARAAEESFAPDGFIRIATNGDITLIIPQAEMGQGCLDSERSYPSEMI